MPKTIILFIINSIPALIVLFLAIIFIAPKRIEGLSHVMPLIHLIPVFIWASLFPRTIPIWYLAALGMLVDIAIHLPLGFSGLNYVFFLLMIRSQRKYIHKEGFITMWGYFALLLLAMQAIGWAVYSWWRSIPAEIQAAMIQWVLTVCCYPILHHILYPLIERITRMRYRATHG